MRDLSQAYAELNTLSHRIENFLRISNYYNYNDLSNFDCRTANCSQTERQIKASLLNHIPALYCHVSWSIFTLSLKIVHTIMPSKAVPGPFSHPAALLTGNCQTLLSCPPCSPCVKIVPPAGTIPSLTP